MIAPSTQAATCVVVGGEGSLIRCRNFQFLDLCFRKVCAVVFDYTTDWCCYEKVLAVAGADYGALHKFLATSGMTGRVHFPGIDHTGAAGICGVGIGG